MRRSDLTWTCHICKRERPDARISVHQHKVTFAGGIEMTENVRYCNDDPACAQAAETFHFVAEGNA